MSDAIISLAAAVALPTIGGFLTGSATRSGSTSSWYRGLAKPAWNPPPAVFPIVWTTLYVLMGVASWLVWRRRDSAGATLALWLYGAQLAVNLSWSVVFFVGQSVMGALAVIVLLGVLIAGTIAAFWRVDRRAAWLLVPYALWVAFATALSASIAAAN
jgi:tryptophan-rich sensory protein